MSRIALLGFLTTAWLNFRKHGELQRRALHGNDIQADRFATAVHNRISLATHTEMETPGAHICRRCYASTLSFRYISAVAL